MVYYQRRLPHWHPRDTSLFLTWRLAGSLPRGSGAGGSACQNLTPGKAFRLLDRALERNPFGPRWLNHPRIARLTVETIILGERERCFYRLWAWVVMPNHVHLLIRPFHPLSRIMRWLKGSIARKANQILLRTG